MRKAIRQYTLWLLAIVLVLASGCEEPPKEFPAQASVNSSAISGAETSAKTDTETSAASHEEIAVPSDTEASEASVQEKSFTLDTVPAFCGEPYVVINENVPLFTEREYTTDAFESYHELDEFGRCGYAYACVGVETMPTEKRGSIGMVKPTGWQTTRYDIIDGKYLYNRCHLIGYQLTAENANERNLITGTRYLNIEGMLPFENMVADYVKETKHHVLYRVTPVFEGDEMVARGVEMEAVSVEDGGEGISFHIYAYNVQPDIVIDYRTGESRLTVEGNDKTVREYVLNTSRKTYHQPDCPSAASIIQKNKTTRTTTAKQLKEEGYKPCGICISE